MYETNRILVVVKTYPNPSRTYGETVCCAGVDLVRRQWVRMYPITFRRLDDARFAKYQEIECRATEPRKDSRPESRHIDNDSINLIGSRMPAGPKGWARRMALLPPPSRSLEVIYEAQAAKGTSIGMLRPKRIDRLVIEKAKPWYSVFCFTLRVGIPGRIIARSWADLPGRGATAMRGLDCKDPSHGDVHFSGQDDDDLERQVRQHISDAHAPMSPDDARGIVTQDAYEE